MVTLFKRHGASPELAPVGSVVLILLVLVVALGPLRGHTTGLPLVSVKVEPPPDGHMPSQVLVRVDVDALIVNGEPTTDQGMVAVLQAILAGQPDTVVFVEANPSLLYDRVAHVMAAIRKSGAVAVGILPDMPHSPAAPSEYPVSNPSSSTTGSTGVNP